MAFGGGFVKKRRGSKEEGEWQRKTKIRNPRATHKAQNPYYDAMF